MLISVKPFCDSKDVSAAESAPGTSTQGAGDQPRPVPTNRPYAMNISYNLPKSYPPPAARPSVFRSAIGERPDRPSAVSSESRLTLGRAWFRSRCGLPHHVGKSRRRKVMSSTFTRPAAPPPNDRRKPPRVATGAAACRSPCKGGQECPGGNAAHLRYLPSKKEAVLFQEADPYPWMRCPRAPARGSVAVRGRTNPPGSGTG
jgi:hypothetical protein